MPYHCTTCHKIFPALLSQEGDGDEVYEACPGCGNDMFISEVEDYLSDMPAPTTVKQLKIAEKKPFDVAAWQHERDRQQQAEDERIEEYQRIYAEQGKAAAEDHFFNRKTLQPCM